MKVYVYWGVKKGRPLWEEEVILESEKRLDLDSIELERVMIEKGCDIARESVLDLSEKPDFIKAVKLWNLIRITIYRT